jgi:hypothetical protein
MHDGEYGAVRCLYLCIYVNSVAAHITVTVQRQQGAIVITISPTPQSSPTTPRTIQQTIPISLSTEGHHSSHGIFFIFIYILYFVILIHVSSPCLHL